MIVLNTELISEFVGMKVLTKESPSLVKDQKNKLEVMFPNLFISFSGWPVYIIIFP